MCGCRQPDADRGAPVSSTRTAMPARRASVPLVYHGSRALLIRGPATGAGYACYPGETIRVHAPDAPHLIASGAFAQERADGTRR